MRFLLPIATAFLCAACVENTTTKDEPIVIHQAEIDCNTTPSLPDNGLLATNTSETPFANALAESLALEASGDFTASNELYTRVSQELQLISEGLFDPDEYQPPRATSLIK